MATFEESAPKRLILGSARSGTTWVLDCLAEANDLRPIFEPLDPLESKLTARHANDCMASDDSNPELERLFRNLAAGSVHSRWIDYRGPRRLWLPRPEGNPRGTAYAKRWLRQWRSYLRTHMMMRTAVRRKETLIKCVRANLMASWLAQTIGFRIALIVRHPCAVVESQYRLRSPIVRNPGPVLARYRASERLHQQTEGRYLSLLHAELTTIEALTLNWVIENQWPIEQSEEAGYVVVPYEDLNARPEIAWPHLCSSLDLARIPSLDLLRRPSQSSERRANSSNHAQHEPRWRSNLTHQQLQAIQKILDLTECVYYNIKEIEPAVDRPGTVSSAQPSAP